MLVEADAVIAEPVQLLPCREMLGVGADRDVGLEMALRQRIGQLDALLDVVEILAIGEQIEDEDLHALAPRHCGYAFRCHPERSEGPLLRLKGPSLRSG